MWCLWRSSCAGQRLEQCGYWVWPLGACVELCQGVVGTGTSVGAGRAQGAASVSWRGGSWSGLERWGRCVCMYGKYSS